MSAGLDQLWVHLLRAPVSLSRRPAVKRTAAVLTASRREVARVLGVSLRTVGNLEAAGVITPARRGRGGRASLFDLCQAVPAYISHVSTAPVASEERAARARRDTAAARLNELKIAREEGGLVSRVQVIAAGLVTVRMWRAWILRFPYQLVRTGVIDEAQRLAVDHACRELLTMISQFKPIDDDYEAAATALEQDVAAQATTQGPQQPVLED